ncbi:unnamed protein product [Clonostachys solani]|uniref:Uncharacterized protein n=1 Tax=Clonostachys solani TaxID=160281 RepID=A0A9N9Z209_9HYPO|nr:unnamed protein product [Clonostachys solani]
MVVVPPRSYDSEEPSPPQYTCLKVADREAAAVEDAWEAMAPRKWQKVRFFNLEFTCAPKAFHKNKNFIRRTLRDRKTQPYWKAKLFVKAKNIPRLMRQGFHLSVADLIPGSGEVHFYDEERAKEDTSGDPEWTATLEVFAKSYFTVMSFRLGWITPDTVFMASAFRWDEKQVYQACTSRSSHSFNTLFDEMPTGGWWPAPKDMQNQREPRFLRLSDWVRTITRPKDSQSTA